MRFSECSHGFRPRKNCHIALERIYYKWRGVKWFIEADISKCFDKILHPILLGLVDSHLDDYLIPLIIRSIFKADYINFGGLVYNELENKIGTPQGFVLSQLFCNILLHEFDKQVSLICTKTNSDLKYKKL